MSLALQQNETNGEPYFILNAQSVAQLGKHPQMKGQSCKRAWRNLFLSCKAGTKGREHQIIHLHFYMCPNNIRVKCPQDL